MDPPLRVDDPLAPRPPLPCKEHTVNIHQLAEQLAAKDQALDVRVLVDGVPYDITGISITIEPEKPEAAYALTIEPDGD